MENSIKINCAIFSGGNLKNRSSANRGKIEKNREVVFKWLQVIGKKF